MWGETRGWRVLELAVGSCLDWDGVLYVGSSSIRHGGRERRARSGGLRRVGKLLHGAARLELLRHAASSLTCGTARIGSRRRKPQRLVSVLGAVVVATTAATLGLKASSGWALAAVADHVAVHRMRRVVSQVW